MPEDDAGTLVGRLHVVRVIDVADEPHPFAVEADRLLHDVLPSSTEQADARPAETVAPRRALRQTPISLASRLLASLRGLVGPAHSRSRRTENTRLGHGPCTSLSS